MPWPKGKPKPPEWRKKVSDTLRKKMGRTVLCAYCGKEFRPRGGLPNRFCSQRCSGLSSTPKGVFPSQLHTPEAEEKSRLARIGIRYSDEINKKKGRLGRPGPKHSPETRLKISESAKRRMKDPAYLKLLFQRLNLRPNKAELKLQSILNKYFEGQWKYTGDGSLLINFMNPDFVNTNGKKAVIELFGEYHHTLKKQPWHHSELGRVMALASFGFKCLVIWDYELKNESAVVQKVEQFMRSKHAKV